MPTNSPRSPNRVRPDLVSSLNALDLALESQKLELDAVDSMRKWLPLLEQIEKVCRGFDQLGTEAVRERSQSVALLADLAASVASENELVRITDVGERVDATRHEVVEARSEPGAERGVILAVKEAGWSFRGRILLPAKVVVAGG